MKTIKDFLKGFKAGFKAGFVAGKKARQAPSFMRQTVFAETFERVLREELK